MNWSMREARNKLSEVIRRARTEGPQTVLNRGHETVVVISQQEFDMLIAKAQAAQAEASAASRT